MSSLTTHHLAPGVLEGKPERVPTRDGFGKGLVEAAEADPAVVALCADLAESTRIHWFQEKFPDRYVELGVAEQNLVTVASGMAAVGKIPFVSSYAAFSPGRNYEQIRTTIALNNQNVKIIGSHAGVSVGPDGATHQMLEDIGLMRMLPRMTVISPSDSTEARKATLAAAKHRGPVYIRLAREKTPVVTAPDAPFEIGKATLVVEARSPTIGIIATGPLLYQAITVASAQVNDVPISVLNLSTIKPIDERAILELAARVKGIVTVEEHQLMGGMSSAVAEVLAKKHPLPIEMVGMKDRFGESGEPDELIAHFGLDSKGVALAIERLLTRL